jgi:uncharacterized membrane protein (DUF2068 family)
MIAPFGVQGFSTGDTSTRMSTVLINVPVLTVVLTIARISLLKEFSFEEFNTLLY